MKTLHLTLRKKWFDLILSGEKKEEYREIKDYWYKRLVNRDCLRAMAKAQIAMFYQMVKDGNMPDEAFPEANKTFESYYVPFDTITFKNGYAADAPEMVVEFKGIEVKEGNPEWGAIPGTKYFTINLGKIISTKNTKP